jgi:branched-subunit amino acid ABC-type transport system permease component
MRRTFCCRCCGRASSAGTLYSLIALGFVLIFKASGVFNFAQGIMVVFAALTLVGLYNLGMPAWIALIATIGVMALLAMGSSAWFCESWSTSQTSSCSWPPSG